MKKGEGVPKSEATCFGICFFFKGVKRGKHETCAELF
jgi:hypothetical protein